MFVIIPVLLSVWVYTNREVEIPNESTEKVSTISIEDAVIQIDIADSLEERVRGLSDRFILEENRGLLFVFEKSDFHGIWMKDMLFPIDIIWLDNDLSIIDFKKDVLPESYPEIFKPKEKAKYVLEVGTGFIDLHQISIGDMATLK
jgi:hypothetical protein